MIAPGLLADLDEAGEEGSACFVVRRPPPGAPACPLVFASPHSGRIYPDSLMAASPLGIEAIRRSEDAYVDALLEAAPRLGVVTIAARLARAWLDLNREPWELDSRMFDGDLPPHARGQTVRVAAGLGAIARIVGEGQEIYLGKLAVADALARVETVHRPYHAALSALVAEARAACGQAILIDWHSMPEAAAGPLGAPRCDVVLGDRFGAACSPAISRRVEHELVGLGFRVQRNTPYAGGYTTEHYGRPRHGVHALQIELNRGLYLDEASLAPTAGLAPLRSRLERLFASLAAIDWARA